MTPVAQLHRAIVVASSLKEAGGPSSAEAIWLEGVWQAYSSDGCIEEQPELPRGLWHKEIARLTTACENMQQPDNGWI